MPDNIDKALPLSVLSTIRDWVKSLIPSTYAGSSSAGGNATKANTILYGEVDSTSTSTAFTATISGLTELTDGTIIMLKNGVVTSASGFTININNLGAKPCYSNMATGNDITPTAPTRDTTIFNINYTMLFVYSTDIVSGGGWICYRGYDANTNTIGYQLRTNSMSLPTTDKFYRYRILFTSADGTHFVPSNTSTSTNATSARAVNQRPIDPFGRIVYYNYTTAIEANARPGATYLMDQMTLALGYSFNRTGAALTLTAWEPVYVKCQVFANGAIIDPDTPYVQTLPTYDDGNIYILLGVAYSATNIELTMHHPVYWYRDGKIRLYVGHREGMYDLGLTERRTEQGQLVAIDKVRTLLPNQGRNTVELVTDSWIDTYFVPKTRTINGQSLQSNITLPIPTKTSELENDSGFITSYTAPSNLSDFYNDVGYITPSSLSTATCQKALFPIVVSGSTAYLNYPLYWVANQYSTVGDAVFLQPLSEMSSMANAVMRVYNLVHVDMPNGTITLTAVDDDSTVHIIELTDDGNDESMSGTYSTVVTPTKTSDLTNDSGFITGYTETDPTVPSWAKASTKPSYTASEVGAIPTTGGDVNGGLTLKSAAATNSPSLIFQRGTLTDNYNDWQIQDRGGFLYFDQRGQGSSDFSNQVCFNTSGNVTATSFTGSGASLTNLNASNLSSGTVPAARLDLSSKQDVLVSGTSIKTINGNSILGSGDLTVGGSVTAMTSAEIMVAVQSGWGASIPDANRISY